VAHSRQVVRCHPMETLEHLDADSETDAISDIQPVLNVTPNVHQTSVILASVRHQTHCKYAMLSGSYVFLLIAMETLGPINESVMQFLNNLGHRITSVSTDDKEAQFLFQRLSSALQRFIAILLHESFGSDVNPDL